MKKQPSVLQRNKRNPVENLSERITFRLSRSEREALEAKASERGIKLSHLCRLIVMRRKIPDRSLETRQWLRDIIGMNNNLNQIARHVNTQKQCDQWAIDALKYIATELSKAKQSLTNNNDYEQSI
jgi:hypothetical protein